MKREPFEAELEDARLRHRARRMPDIEKVYQAVEPRGIKRVDCGNRRVRRVLLLVSKVRLLAFEYIKRQ